jgi:hypothetical protein
MPRVQIGFWLDGPREPDLDRTVPVDFRLKTSRNFPKLPSISQHFPERPEVGVGDGQHAAPLNQIVKIKNQN